MKLLLRPIGLGQLASIGEEPRDLVDRRREITPDELGEVNPERRPLDMLLLGAAGEPEIEVWRRRLRGHVRVRQRRVAQGPAHRRLDDLVIERERGPFPTQTYPRGRTRYQPPRTPRSPPSSRRDRRPHLPESSRAWWVIIRRHVDPRVHRDAGNLGPAPGEVSLLASAGLPLLRRLGALPRPLEALLGPRRVRRPPRRISDLPAARRSEREQNEEGNPSAEARERSEGSGRSGGGGSPVGRGGDLGRSGRKSNVLAARGVMRATARGYWQVIEAAQMPLAHTAGFAAVQICPVFKRHTPAASHVFVDTLHESASSAFFTGEHIPESCRCRTCTSYRCHTRRCNRRRRRRSRSDSCSPGRPDRAAR